MQLLFFSQAKIQKKRRSPPLLLYLIIPPVTVPARLILEKEFTIYFS